MVKIKGAYTLHIFQNEVLKSITYFVSRNEQNFAYRSMKIGRLGNIFRIFINSKLNKH